jgi:hypothetical protein
VSDWLHRRLRFCLRTGVQGVLVFADGNEQVFAKKVKKVRKKRKEEQEGVFGGNGKQGRNEMKR